jgi:heme oxygenase
MDTTVKIPTFLGKLRVATSQSHTNLEALPVSVSIMNPNVSNEEYALYLTLMHDIVKDAEENIFPVAKAVLPELDVHPKAHFIEADLNTLGAVKKTSYSPLSSKIDVDTISPAFALGVMYVIEGSSLGGRVILKNITGALNHTAESGASYFAGYGGQTGSHWKSFLENLTGYEAKTDSQNDIIKGADFAFNAIASHFKQNDQE